ncbi:MAG: 50S ribosomal protein L10 [bacterium]|nr:50S ribosomal protein L10 [bacterium]
MHIRKPQGPATDGLKVHPAIGGKMPTQKKIETVAKLAEKLASAKSVILTDYHGLTHQQIEQLRKTIKKVDGDFIVAKNTLLARTFTDTNYQLLATTAQPLSGPTALLLSYKDELSPLQALAGFIKQFQLPVLRIGILDGKLLNGEELIAITKLPPKGVLLAQLVWQLSSPLYRLHHALQWNLQKLVLTLKAVENSKVEMTTDKNI